MEEPKEEEEGKKMEIKLYIYFNLVIEIRNN